VGCELLDENDLKVTVVIEEILEVLGRALSPSFTYSSAMAADSFDCLVVKSKCTGGRPG